MQQGSSSLERGSGLGIGVQGGSPGSGLLVWAAPCGDWQGGALLPSPQLLPLGPVGRGASLPTVAASGLRARSLSQLQPKPLCGA